MLVLPVVHFLFRGCQHAVFFFDLTFAIQAEQQESAAVRDPVKLALTGVAFDQFNIVVIYVKSLL